MRPVFFSVFLIVLFACSTSAQFRVPQHRPSSSPSFQDERETSDTLGLSARAIRPEIGEPKKSTSLAMLLSAGVPGAGQIYVERYLTIPVIWGFGGYFYKQMSKAGDFYDDYRTRYTQSIGADTVSHVGSARLRELRDFYHDQRDRFAIYLGLTYLLNIVDAYVGASLYGFDVSEDLGGNTKLNVKIPINEPLSQKKK